jgi:hypothetical protein
MAISPTTQSFMQPPPTTEDETQAFEAGFGQMAHNLLAAKYPDLVDQVATFKVIESDIQTGSAIGMFLLSRGGETLHIPVVLANNQIKPLEIMYSKDKNIFLPLKHQWLEEIDRGSIDSLGEGVKPPKNLETDMDIRNLVIPPAVGRYSYASVEKGATLVRFLHESPNHVKIAFAKILENNKKILKFAFEQFDREDLLEAMTPVAEKAAAERAPLVEVLTVGNSEDEFLNAFRNDVASAFQEAVKEGYVVKDQRVVSNVAINHEEPLKLHQAKESGFYRVQLVDGRFVYALVVAPVQSLEASLYGGKRTDLERKRNEYRAAHKKKDRDMLENESPDHDTPVEPDHVRFLIYTEDGDIFTTDKPPLGEKVVPAAMSGKLADVMAGGDSTVTPGYGFFVCFKGGKVTATEPTEVMSISTGTDGTRRIKTTTGRVLVTNAQSPIAAVIAPKGSMITHIPASYKFIKGSRNYTDKIICNADVALRYSDRLRKHASYAVKIHRDGLADAWIIRGAPHSGQPLTKLGAITTLVKDLDLRARDAKEILEKTAEKGHHSFYVVRPMEFLKFATWVKEGQGMAAAPPPMQPPGMAPVPAAPPPPPVDPMAAGGMPPPMDPMAGPSMMDPMMAPPMPMAPPPPSPVDQAVVEISSELAQQAADVAEQMAEQQRDLATHLEVLQAVKQRADEIVTEQTGMPMGPEAGMPMGPEAGMPMGPEAGMPMAPEAGMPMGPEAGGMPVDPTSMMSPDMMASGASPFMDQAADLGDEQAFEATAIGSLAANADLKSIVGNYMPNLEEALDNLGRILMSIWIKEDELRTDFGEMDYIDLEEKLRNVFNNLGNLILRINQTAMTAPSQDEQEVT